MNPTSAPFPYSHINTDSHFKEKPPVSTASSCSEAPNGLELKAHLFCADQVLHLLQAKGSLDPELNPSGDCKHLRDIKLSSFLIETLSHWLDQPLTITGNYRHSTVTWAVEVTLREILELYPGDDARLCGSGVLALLLSDKAYLCSLLFDFGIRSEQCEVFLDTLLQALPPCDPTDFDIDFNVVDGSSGALKLRQDKLIGLLSKKLKEKTRYRNIKSDDHSLQNLLKHLSKNQNITFRGNNFIAQQLLVNKGAFSKFGPVTSGDTSKSCDISVECLHSDATPLNLVDLPKRARPLELTFKRNLENTSPLQLFFQSLAIPLSPLLKGENHDLFLEGENSVKGLWHLLLGCREVREDPRLDYRGWGRWVGALTVGERCLTQEAADRSTRLLLDGFPFKPGQHGFSQALLDHLSDTINRHYSQYPEIAIPYTFAACQALDDDVSEEILLDLWDQTHPIFQHTKCENPILAALFSTLTERSTTFPEAQTYLELIAYLDLHGSREMGGQLITHKGVPHIQVRLGSYPIRVPYRPLETLEDLSLHLESTSQLSPLHECLKHVLAKNSTLIPCLIPPDTVDFEGLSDIMKYSESPLLQALAVIFYAQFQDAVPKHQSGIMPHALNLARRHQSGDSPLTVSQILDTLGFTDIDSKRSPTSWLLTATHGTASHQLQEAINIWKLFLNEEGHPHEQAAEMTRELFTHALSKDLHLACQVIRHASFRGYLYPEELTIMVEQLIEKKCPHNDKQAIIDTVTYVMKRLPPVNDVTKNKPHRLSGQVLNLITSLNSLKHHEMAIELSHLLCTRGFLCPKAKNLKTLYLKALNASLKKSPEKVLNHIATTDANHILNDSEKQQLLISAIGCLTELQESTIQQLVDAKFSNKQLTALTPKLSLLIQKLPINTPGLITLLKQLLNTGKAEILIPLTLPAIEALIEKESPKECVELLEAYLQSAHPNKKAFSQALEAWSRCGFPRSEQVSLEQKISIISRAEAAGIFLSTSTTFTQCICNLLTQASKSTRSQHSALISCLLAPSTLKNICIAEVLPALIDVLPSDKKEFSKNKNLIKAALPILLMESDEETLPRLINYLTTCENFLSIGKKEQALERALCTALTVNLSELGHYRVTGILNTSYTQGWIKKKHKTPEQNKLLSTLVQSTPDPTDAFDRLIRLPQPLSAGQITLAWTLYNELLDIGKHEHCDAIMTLMAKSKEIDLEEKRKRLHAHIQQHINSQRWLKAAQFLNEHSTTLLVTEKVTQTVCTVIEHLLEDDNTHLQAALKLLTNHPQGTHQLSPKAYTYLSTACSSTTLDIAIQLLLKRSMYSHLDQEVYPVCWRQALAACRSHPTPLEEIFVKEDKKFSAAIQALPVEEQHSILLSTMHCIAESNSNKISRPLANALIKKRDELWKMPLSEENQKKAQALDLKLIPFLAKVSNSNIQQYSLKILLEIINYTNTSKDKNIDSNALIEQWSQSILNGPVDVIAHNFDATNLEALWVHTSTLPQADRSNTVWMVAHVIQHFHAAGIKNLDSLKEEIGFYLELKVSSTREDISTEDFPEFFNNHIVSLFRWLSNRSKKAYIVTHIFQGLKKLFSGTPKALDVYDAYHSSRFQHTPKEDTRFILEQMQALIEILPILIPNKEDKTWKLKQCFFPLLEQAANIENNKPGFTIKDGEGRPVCIYHIFAQLLSALPNHFFKGSTRNITEENINSLDFSFYCEYLKCLLQDGPIIDASSASRAHNNAKNTISKLLNVPWKKCPELHKNLIELVRIYIYRSCSRLLHYPHVFGQKDPLGIMSSIEKSGLLEEDNTVAKELYILCTSKRPKQNPEELEEDCQIVAAIVKKLCSQNNGYDYRAAISLIKKAMHWQGKKEHKKALHSVFTDIFEGITRSIHIQTHEEEAHFSDEHDASRVSSSLSKSESSTATALLKQDSSRRFSNMKAVTAAWNFIETVSPKISSSLKQEYSNKFLLLSHRVTDEILEGQSLIIYNDLEAFHQRYCEQLIAYLSDPQCDHELQLIRDCFRTSFSMALFLNQCKNSSTINRYASLTLQLTLKHFLNKSSNINDDISLLTTLMVEGYEKVKTSDLRKVLDTFLSTSIKKGLFQENSDALRAILRAKKACTA